jgi:chromosome segregation ATPase
MSSDGILKEILIMVNSIGTGVTNLGIRMEAVESRLEHLESRMEGVESRLESVESRLGVVESRLDRVESTVNSQFDESRPFLLSVQQQLSELRSKMESSFRQLDRKFDQLIRESFDDRANLSDLSHRVEKLEEKAS